MSRYVCNAALVAFCLFITACATIVGDKTQLIPISSTPSDASIMITDEKGVVVFKGTTPTSVTLQKSNGSYWGKKSFILKVHKEGYESQMIPITASANSWYIGGNIIFGGLIGWFIVDPYNGAMYNLSPEQLSAHLDAKGGQSNYSHEQGFSIVLLEDVPEALRSKMRSLN